MAAVVAVVAVAAVAAVVAAAVVVVLVVVVVGNGHGGGDRGVEGSERRGVTPRLTLAKLLLFHVLRYVQDTVVVLGDVGAEPARRSEGHGGTVYSVQ